jgi:ubiquitin carboxyl-terminal hydrolase L5
MSWCTIESDPGLFSEIICNLGVNNVSVEEIYSLEESEQQREPSYGLIFLFKYKAEHNNPSASGTTRRVLDVDEYPEDLFFARQVVPNACATQAILNIKY